MRLVVCALLLSGCADGPTDTGELIPDLAECGFLDETIGQLDVSVRADVYHGDRFGRVEGQLWDGPEPRFHTVVAEQGSCRRYEVAYGSCDPACGPGEICQADAQCVAFPAGRSGGTLTTQGLEKAVQIDTESWSPGAYRSPGGLTEHLFKPGQPVGVGLDGDDFPSVSMVALGVTLLDPGLVTEGWQMSDGADAELTWKPGANPDACVGLVLYGFNQTHGAPVADIIRCETSDTGSLRVPEALVEAFPHGTTLEVTEGYDWPHSTLTRYTRSRTQTSAGTVELLVRSTNSFLLSHPESN
jgi:hypothetical protein